MRAAGVFCLWVQMSGGVLYFVLSPPDVVVFRRRELPFVDVRGACVNAMYAESMFGDLRKPIWEACWLRGVV